MTPPARVGAPPRFDLPRQPAQGQKRAPLPTLLLACWLLLRCGWLDAPGEETLAFSVADSTGAAVQGAEVAVDGQFAGKSDAAGNLRALHQGSVGQKLEVQLTCPAGFSAAPERSVLVFRPTTSEPVPHALRCRRPPPETVVVVHAPGGGSLPVLVNGSPIGKTDALGVAHVLVRQPPGSRLELALDTGSAPHLFPQNPRKAFDIGSRNDAFVFHRPFQ